jgi:uncharacterized membrane protein
MARFGDRSAMSPACLVAVVYGDAETAENALAALAEPGVSLEDAAVVVRDDQGGVSLRQRHALAAGEGAVGGGTIGLLVGLAIGLPVAGAVVGIAGGAGASIFDTGISDDEMRNVGKTLEAGRAALFALVADPDWKRVRERLAPYGGEVVTSEVDAATLAALTPPAP